MDDAQIMAGLRRLAARGDWVIMPSLTGAPPASVVWWPLGQGPGRSGKGNPFCRRGFAGTLAEVVARALEATRPRERSIDDLTIELDLREREHLLPRSSWLCLIPARWPLPDDDGGELRAVSGG